MMRTILASGLVGLSAVVLSGCMGPTYGTGRPATEQLLEDLGGIVSVSPPGTAEQEAIAYNPRPALVRPPSTEILPPPQQAATESGTWPESPEQRRLRLRAEATENQDNNTYRSPLATNVSQNQGIVSAARIGERGNFENNSTTSVESAEFQRRLALAQQGDPTQRRLLSEPPIEYRQPSATAPSGELGEDEWAKEQRMRQATGSGSSWRDWIPWL